MFSRLIRAAELSLFQILFLSQFRGSVEHPALMHILYLLERKKEKGAVLCVGSSSERAKTEGLIHVKWYKNPSF